MSFCILAPDELIDTSYLEVDPEGSFLDAFARLTVSTLKHNLSFAGRAREKSEWRYDLRREIASSQTNAFYYGTFNQFFVFAGYVTDSTYRADMPSEEKLAKLGEIIGHELTHGFDPTGIRYDMNGNLPVSDDSISGWLPEEDYDTFMERARKAFERNGVEPVVQPIRGGTDGAQLSFRGLPCPNLSTGGYNFHGRKELIPVPAMEKMVDVLVSLVTEKTEA